MPFIAAQALICHACLAVFFEACPTLIFQLTYEVLIAGNAAFALGQLCPAIPSSEMASPTHSAAALVQEEVCLDVSWFCYT